MHRSAVPNAHGRLCEDVTRASDTNGICGSIAWGVDEDGVRSAQIHEAARLILVPVVPLWKRNQQVGRIGNGLFVADEKELANDKGLGTAKVPSMAEI